ncbi:acetyl/propionyl/methylcrotonyl-CoA carboxylase subunit alpha [Sunxiuqinia dokdonensis]|uniref:Biotin carboxylase n=1 Tax=Sunxiuqinia dokdonensis TaxID=1409788 RepID=A0A0L8V8K5_9BACT|nr:biotin carboxylase N-terminal domain-containing protein [Sunxiuqinia dokdonensis]KOH44532.1 hypothetical protein NC99_27620 [Sunxiuqinia dokdonensis]
MSLFHKILIANRGEIAVRVIKTARGLGIATVAVYAADDSGSLHVELADQAVLLEGTQLSETYLNQEKIIETALACGAEAIHPGYGFLSENADFANRVEQAGLGFIGATPDQIRLMGEKTQAIAFVKSLGIPVIPGMTGLVDDILSRSHQLVFPVLVKASCGGGGKGMEVVHDLAALPAALKRAQRQAEQYFGNGELFVEKFLSGARHIEVQLLGDGQGNAVHLFERECSIQRRYQKLIEESPAQTLSEETRGQLYQAAVQIARETKYRGAGTIEFLVDEEDNFYFLEMNTRLQVEHPVTELVTGQDLVAWQLRMAAGEQLSLKQSDLEIKGHAMELRICAEDPLHDFRPTSGLVGQVHVPNDARWDSFLRDGTSLSSNYDSLVGKLIVWAETRDEAREKMCGSLASLHIDGLSTNQEFLLELVKQQDFKQNNINTRWVEDQLPTIVQSLNQSADSTAAELLTAYVLHHFYRPVKSTKLWKALGYWRMMHRFRIQSGAEWHEIEMVRKEIGWALTWNETTYDLRNYHFNGSIIDFQLNNKDITIFISGEEDATVLQLKGKKYRLRSNHIPGQVCLNKLEVAQGELKMDQVVANLFGKVIAVLVKPGDLLQKGQNLLVIESMKSEFTIQSPVDAVVKNIHVSQGHLVQDKQLLVDLES